jgi:hypothetical protein
MIPSLLVAAAITAPAAPIPKDASPNITGPAPRVVAVKADGNGSVWIHAQVWQKQKVTQQFFANENGKQVLKQQEVEQNVATYIQKTLGEFGGRFSTADGTVLSTEDATRRVKDGATLLVTADGKPIGKGWLRAVQGDTVVMQAEGLAHAQFQYNVYNPANSQLPTTAAPRLVLLRTDDSGAVKLAVNSLGDNANNGQIYYDQLGGGRMIGGRAVMVQGAINVTSYSAPSGITGTATGEKLLTDVKFDAFDTNGKRVPKAEAYKRLKAGGLVLVAGDTQFPDRHYLTGFRDDILVLVSGEFVFHQGQPNPYDMPVKTTPDAPPGPGKPAMPPPPIAVPAIGVVAPAIQLRAAPMLVKPPAPAIAPAAKPVAKPAEKPGKPR